MEPRLSWDGEPKPRNVLRTATDFAIEIYHPDGKTLRAISRILDLSTAGACLDSTSDLGEEDEFLIRLLLGRRTVVSVPARVVWKRYFSKTFQYGLQFQDCPQDVRSAISQFVGRRAEDPARVGVEDVIQGGLQ